MMGSIDFVFLCSFTVSVIWAASLSPKTIEDSDPGFDLYMGYDNLEEYDNHPIQFDHPLPDWLKGSLIRNGVGRYEVGNRKVENLLDGFAKITKWTFPGDGTTSFSTKFLRTSFYNESMSSNDIAPYATLGPLDPPFTLEETLKALENGMDNPNVNVYNFTENIVVLYDLWIMYNIDPRTLNLQEKINADVPNAKMGFPYASPISCAHPLQEIGTEHHLTFLGSLALLPGLKHKLTLVRVKSSTDREMIAQWEVENMPYMHSFSVTKKYAIFLGSPYFYEIQRMLKNLNMADTMVWYPDKPTMIYLVELSTGKVQTLQTECMFTMHHINAFEMDDQHIAVDVSDFGEAGVFSRASVEVIRNQTLRNSLLKSQPVIKRYILNLKDNTVDVMKFPSPARLPFSSNFDLPTINEKYRGKEYCFVYGFSAMIDGINYSNSSIVKKDMCKNTTDRAWFMKHHYLMEAWFVPFPQGTAEDDGYLLTPVLDGENRKSYLAVIDARNMTLVNKAELPTTVPFNIHGRLFDL
ncbi:hypothetical protein FSP39_013602 [Pinctada imbricata]|uniref:Uncharacterized protein n=1 Tax=Pinctada imbricata TaxID=66713 RepID=A0AA88Y8T9_PINIB|nr:hypothetical protein FSP39_013602 [Pinctada imbricata]